MLNNLNGSPTSPDDPDRPPESPSEPKSAQLIDEAVTSFKKAKSQELMHAQKHREAWYEAMGKVHHLVGVLRSDKVLQAFLRDKSGIRQHAGTSDQLYLLKLVYKRAGLSIPDQTQHDHSLILIGLEAAKVPTDVEAAEKWLKEEEDLGQGPVSGKEKAVAYARRAQKDRPPNKAAQTRIANAAQKRQAQFESYVTPKLSAPLAELPIRPGASEVADGYLICFAKKENGRILLLDVIASDEMTVQTTALNKHKS